jgi:hypothetical protein
MPRTGLSSLCAALSHELRQICSLRRRAGVPNPFESANSFSKLRFTKLRFTKLHPIEMLSSAENAPAKKTARHGMTSCAKASVFVSDSKGSELFRSFLSIDAADFLSLPCSPRG